MDKRDEVHGVWAESPCLEDRVTHFIFRSMIQSVPCLIGARDKYRCVIVWTLHTYTQLIFQNAPSLSLKIDVIELQSEYNSILQLTNLRRYKHEHSDEKRIHDKQIIF
jgi:hypothetical protein